MYKSQGSYRTHESRTIVTNAQDFVYFYQFAFNKIMTHNQMPILEKV